jgi:hypothetical protein
MNNYNDIDENINQSRLSSKATTNGIRKSFNNFYLLNEANEKDRIYSAKYNINLFNSKSKPINVDPPAPPPPRIPQSLPPSHHNIANTQECPDHECCSLNNDAMLTLTSTDDKAKIEELIKRCDLEGREKVEGEGEKDREFLEADMKSITDDATTLLLSTPNKLNADDGDDGVVEEEEGENYYYELLTNDERKACSYDLGRLDTKKEESTMNHYEEIDKQERQECLAVKNEDVCEGDDDCMYSTLSEEEEEDDDDDDDSAGSSSASSSSSSYNSTSTPASCTSHSSRSRNDTMSIEVITKEEQSKKVSDLKRGSTNTNADKINFKKCIFKSSKLAQKKRVKRIFLISTMTNSKFNFLANQKNSKKREGVEADLGKVKETKESVKIHLVKPKTQSKTYLQEAKTVRENEMIIGDDEEIADENQASGIELNARADDFYFEYDFDYDLNEQIKSSDEDFTLYSYNDLLNNNNNNTASNVVNMKNDIDSNHAVNGNSSFTSKTDEQDDEEDNVEDEEDEEEEEEEENDEEHGNGDENEQNNDSDGCINEQDEIEQEKVENNNNEAVEKPKEKKSKELNLIVHRLPGL